METVCHALLPPAACTTSQIIAKTQSPMGSATSIGWTGCFLILAGLAIVAPVPENQIQLNQRGCSLPCLMMSAVVRFGPDSPDTLPHQFNPERDVLGSYHRYSRAVVLVHFAHLPATGSFVSYSERQP